MMNFDTIVVGAGQAGPFLAAKLVNRGRKVALVEARDLGGTLGNFNDALRESYLGIALFGALFIAAGTFASALTKNQIIAAIVSFVMILALFLAGVFRELVTDPKLREGLGYLNLIEHMDDFARGLVDTRRVVYVVSAVVFFLFLATKSLQGNKGK